MCCSLEARGPVGGEGRGGWRQARSLAVNQSPAFDVGPGLTPGRPLATARGAVGCGAFLGAIYASGGRRGKFLLWGGGVGGGRCSRVEGLGVVRIMEGAEAQGSTLLTQSGSPNLLG